MFSPRRFNHLTLAHPLRPRRGVPKDISPVMDLNIPSHLSRLCPASTRFAILSCFSRHHPVQRTFKTTSPPNQWAMNIRGWNGNSVLYASIRNVKTGKTMSGPIHSSHDSVPAESDSRPWTSSSESRRPRTTETHTYIAVFARSALLTVAFPGLEAGRCSADHLRLFRRPCTMCPLGERRYRESQQYDRLFSNAPARTGLST